MSFWRPEFWPWEASAMAAWPQLCGGVVSWGWGSGDGRRRRRRRRRRRDGGAGEFGDGMGGGRRRRNRARGEDGREGNIRRIILRLLRPHERALPLPLLSQLNGHLLRGSCAEPIEHLDISPHPLPIPASSPPFLPPPPSPSPPQKSAQNPYRPRFLASGSSPLCCIFACST